MIPLVILDRDGVINQDSPNFIKSPAEWQPIPGSLEAISQLNRANIPVVIASNQSGIGRGLFTLSTLQNIHQKMNNALETIGGHIDAILFCPHIPDDNCDCRKPKTGLFKTALAKFQIANNQSVIAVGDSLRDLQAAQDAGCNPHLVLTGNGQKTAQALPNELRHTPIYPDLLTLVKAVLGNINHANP